MIPIFIDTRALTSEFAISRVGVDNLLRNVVGTLTSTAYRLWQQQAGQKLGKSRVTYQRSLVVLDTGKFSGSVVLKGALPNMIESGVTAFDMKKGFAKSTKIKNGKNGWYLTVPFRFATPGSAGFSEVFSGGVLPTKIYSLVKNQALVEGSNRSKGLSLNEIPKTYRAPQVRPTVVGEGRKQFEQYTRKTSQYEGLTKVGMGKGSGYITFRRVSEKSDPNSWIHTGIAARKLADSTLSLMNIPDIVDREIDNFLSQQGF